jgi:hypothetical protein
VRLHGYVFLSNHLHLIISARGLIVADFMRYLLSNLAKKLSPLCRSRWWGRFWERRYSATPILDEEALEARLRYVLSHGVKEGLVAHAREWEGLHCAMQLTNETPLGFRWFDWTKRWSAKRRPGFNPRDISSRYAAEFAEDEVLELAPLPHWAAMPPAQRRAAAVRLVRDVELEHKKEHVLGMTNAKRESTALPQKRKRTPRPMCHATSREAHHQHRLEYRQFASVFRAASGEWLQGNVTAEFPADCFKPRVPNETERQNV